MIASTSPTRTVWIALGALCVACAACVACAWMAGGAPAVETPIDLPADELGFETGFALDLEPSPLLEIDNRWGTTRVEHADVARISISASGIRDEHTPRCTSGPTASGWQFVIGARTEPRGAIDLVVRVPRATTVVVKGLVD